MIESIKKIYGNSNTKITTRQNDINEEVCNFMQSQSGYDKFDFKKEEILKTPNSVGNKPTFKVDIAIYDNDKLVEVVLNKAPFSNLKQNESNSIGSRINEVFRLANDFPEIKITWFNFLPKQTPYFKKNGLVKNLEINNPHSICNDNFRKLINTSVNLNEIFVVFDWDGIQINQNKSDFESYIRDGIMSFTNIEIKEFNC